MADMTGNLFQAMNGTGKANYGAAAGDLFGAAGDIFGGFAAASGSRAAATQYRNAAEFTTQQTALKTAMATRALYQSNSAIGADVGSNGFQLGGSAGDILRANAEQGALTKGAITLQGAAQESAYLQQAKAAKAAASGQMIGGIISGVASVAAAFL